MKYNLIYFILGLILFVIISGTIENRNFGKYQTCATDSSEHSRYVYITNTETGNIDVYKQDGFLSDDFSYLITIKNKQ